MSSRRIGSKGSLTARTEFPSPRLDYNSNPWARSHTLLKNKQRYVGRTAASGMGLEQYQSHEFSFDAIFRNPDTKQLFHSFLVLSQNEEPFVFYDQVSLFKATGSAKIAQTIYRSFIQERAVHEINLGQQLRLTIIARYEECVEKKLLFPIDLFDSAQKSIYLELKHDPFQRFIASSLFSQFVSTRGETFLNSLRIPDECPSPTSLIIHNMSPRARKMSIQGASNSPRRHSSLTPTHSIALSYGSTEPVITDPDIYFDNLAQRRDSSVFGRADVLFFLSFTGDTLSVAKQSTSSVNSIELVPWTEISSDSKLKLKCYQRPTPEKGYKVFKCSFVLPYPIRTVLYALLADNKYVFPTVQSESASSVTTIEIFKLPFPYQDREFVTCNSLFHMDKSQPQRFILLKKSLLQGVYQDEMKPGKNVVRGHMLLGGYILERGVNDISTKVIQSMVINMGGFIKGDSTWKKMVLHIYKNSVLTVLRDLSVMTDDELSNPPKIISTIKIMS
jgi:hypothetical protein